MFRPISPKPSDKSEDIQKNSVKQRIEWCELSWRTRRNQKELCIFKRSVPEFWDDDSATETKKQIRAEIKDHEKLECTCVYLTAYDDYERLIPLDGENIDYCSRCINLDKLYLQDCYDNEYVKYPTYTSFLESPKGAKRNNKSWKHTARKKPKYDRISAKRRRRNAVADLNEELFF